MRRYTYSWTKSFKADPQAVGEWLQKLRRKTPESIVEAAADPTSPAHDIIWSTPDDEAARQHRLNIARTMTNSLRIEIVEKGRKPRQIQAFIRSADRASYVVSVEATDDELTAAEQRCWEQMKTFRNRYENLKFAEKVVAAIRATERQAVTKQKKKRQA